MRALSVQQPWAGLIASGRKPVELRTWTTRYRGPLMICAGLRVDARGAAWAIREPRGVALCVVDLVDVRVATAHDADAACFDPTALGREVFAWVLADVRRVAPFAVSGRLGLFVVTPPYPIAA